MSVRTGDEEACRALMSFAIDLAAAARELGLGTASVMVDTEGAQDFVRCYGTEPGESMPGVIVTQYLWNGGKK